MSRIPVHRMAVAHCLLLALSVSVASQPLPDFRSEAPQVIDDQASVTDAVEAATHVCVIAITSRQFMLREQGREFAGMSNVLPSITSSVKGRVLQCAKGELVADDQVSLSLDGGQRLSGSLGPLDTDPVETGREYLVFATEVNRGESGVVTLLPVKHLASIYEVSEVGALLPLRWSRVGAQLVGQRIEAVMQTLASPLQ